MSRISGKTGLRAGRAESARRMELFWKLELMPASLILRSAPRRGPCRIGFLLEGFVLEGAGVEASNSALVSATASGAWPRGGGLAVFDSDAVDDVGADGVELALELGDLRRRPFCTRGGWRRSGPTAAKSGGVFEVVGEAVECSPWVEAWAASSRRSDGIVGGLLADAIGLGGGVVGIELEEAGREDAGFLLGVDDVEVLFELGEGFGGLSILARSSSSCFSMKAERPAVARKRMS